MPGRHAETAIKCAISMQMLKTLSALLQAFAMLFTLCACGTPAVGGKFCQNCGSRL